MERSHRANLQRRFGPHPKGKRVVCLDIPDDYDFMQPELVGLLERKVARHLLLPLGEKVDGGAVRMRGRPAPDRLAASRS